MATIELDPDRLFPVDPTTRGIARELHAGVRDLPIVSPHGHVPAAVLADDVPFGDPAGLLVTPDHYVTRLIHSLGVPMDRFGRPTPAGRPPADPREVWRTFCAHWWAFRGTPSRYWIEAELADVFGVPIRPSADTADELFDQLTERLGRPEFRPRALFGRFGLEVLATTDDPCDDLAAHDRLAADPAFPGRVVPTFRPDAYLDPAAPGFAARVERLGAVAGVDTTAYAGYLDALASRRAYFVAHGATCSDHGAADAGTEPLPAPDAARAFAAALTGELDGAGAAAFRRHMLTEMARMACDDGLVMQLHPGVVRNYDSGVFAAYGPDAGFDIPERCDYTRGLRPLLDRYGEHPNFRLVLFTVDETSWSREIAPLAGCYPSVFAGVPWWFLDSPDTMLRFRAAVTDTAGFAKTSGFVDDTRAYCSIPARHDMARRVDCGFLARLVVEGRLPVDEAADVAADLAYALPKRTFRLG